MHKTKCVSPSYFYHIFHLSLLFQPYLILKPVLISSTARLGGTKPTFSSFHFKYYIKNEWPLVYQLQLQLNWIKHKGLLMFCCSGSIRWYRECWIIFQLLLSLLCNICFPQIIVENFCKQRDEKFQIHYKTLFRLFFSVLFFLRPLKLWFLNFIVFHFASVSFVLIIGAL